MRHLLVIILAWLLEHQPVQCGVCFRWLWRKHAIYKQITTGGKMPLCPECDRAIFKPFSRINLN